MGRKLGNASLGINLEPGGQAPLDARLVVATKADLIAADSYAAKNYYKGMIVSVQEDGSVYELINPSKITSSDYSGWLRIDSGGVSLDGIGIINIGDFTSSNLADEAAVEAGRQYKNAIIVYTINGNHNALITNSVCSDGTVDQVITLNHKVKKRKINSGGVASDWEEYNIDGFYLPKWARGDKLFALTKESSNEDILDALKYEFGTGKTTIITEDDLEQCYINGRFLKDARSATPIHVGWAGSYYMLTELGQVGPGGKLSFNCVYLSYNDGNWSCVRDTVTEKIATSSQVSEVSSTLTSHKEDQSNPHNVTKDQVGLGNVTNDAQVKRSEMGVAHGVATLDENGKIPASQLNGDLGRVVGIQKFLNTQAELSSDPNASSAKVGDKYFCKDTKKIYTKTSDGWDEGTDPKDNTLYNHRLADSQGRTNVLYRWDGEEMAEVSASIALGETQGTAYEGSKGKANADAIKELQSKDTAIDAYTVNGKKISTNPTLAAGDINTTSHGTVDSAIDSLFQKDTQLEDSISQGDSTTLQSAKAYTDQQIQTINSAKCVQYTQEVSSGNTVTINKSTHNCGSYPIVKCYYKGEEVMCNVTIASGNVTVSWNGSILSESSKLTIVLLGDTGK